MIPVADGRYELQLPPGIITQGGDFKACKSSDATAASLPARCTGAELGRGSLSTVGGRSTTSAGVGLLSCEFRLWLLKVKKPAGFELRIEASPGSGKKCLSRPTGARMSVVTATRREPAKLRFTFPTTVVGTPPGLGSGGERRVTNGELDFLATGAHAYLASTACPQSGKLFAWMARLSIGGGSAPFKATSTTTCAPAGVTPVKAAKGKATTVTGVVVHQIPHAHSFVLARADGRLFTIATPSPLPLLGTRVTVGAKPLSYGMWAQTCLTLESTPATAAVVQGVVTYVGSHHHAFVLSADGASILLEHQKASTLPPLLHRVTVVVSIRDGKLVEQSIQVGHAYSGRLVV